MGAVPLRGCKGCIRVFYLSNGGATVISKVEHELNEEIRDKEIRLIGDDGEQMGIMSPAEALHIAEEKGLDKELRMSPGIDVGDFNTKLKNAQKFLADGNRVKVSVRFRGREMAHTDIGRDLLKKFAELCADVATMDKSAKMEGRIMSMFLSPKAQKAGK